MRHIEGHINDVRYKHTKFLSVVFFQQKLDLHSQDTQSLSLPHATNMGIKLFFDTVAFTAKIIKLHHF